MKIGVVSDTHGGTAMWERALPILSGADILLHAGDVLYHGPKNPLPEKYDPAKLVEMIAAFSKPLYFARGNCDADVDLMVLAQPFMSGVFPLKLDSLSIILTHGDRYD